jgi:hypothetical protein
MPMDKENIRIAAAELMGDAFEEAVMAMRKFPQPNYVLCKVAEETGEVVKASIHFAEGRETAPAVRKEIVQAIAMLVRLYVEGDKVNGVPSIVQQMMPEEADEN